tara:strand:+ start:120 stop:308 length:189 start_codon:yes stop_codon:yes gene_type:complete
MGSGPLFSNTSVIDDAEYSRTKHLSTRTDIEHSFHFGYGLRLVAVVSSEGYMPETEKNKSLY